MAVPSRKCLLFLAFLTLLINFADAQADKSVPVPPAARAPATAPAPAVPVVPAVTNNDPSKEAAIFERIVTKVSYEADGTGTRETAVAVRVQSQAGVQELAVLTFPYTSDNQTVEFDYVRVRRPDGTTVVTPDYNIQDMPADVTRNAPMYSDIHEKHVTVKGLGIGDLLEYVVRYRTLKPEIAGQFWYEHNFIKLYITRDEELQVSVPRNKYLKVSSPDLQPRVLDDANRRTYIWKTSNLDLKDREALLKKSEAPKPSVQITTFRSWEEVGRWYKELQQPELEVTPQLQAKAAELTKGLTTDDARIRAIYKYVSTRFHYVSLSFGIGRYRPHAAEDVLENEYGDCKDKHTLLATLLKAAGYETWPALINASRKIDPDVPSPGQFNHAISVVPRGNTLIWLDTTPEVSPFGLLLANLRDKQALVMPADKPASLMTTPSELPFPSLETFTANGNLDADGTLTAHVEQTLRGDSEVLFRAAFRNTPAAQWQELGERIAAMGGFGGEASNVTASAPDDIDKPFRVSWDYTRKNFGDWANHQVVAPLPWFGIEGMSNEDKKPEEPVKLGAMGEIIYRSKITLPTGYAPAYSEKEDLTEDFADYHATYAIDHGALTITRRLTIKQDDVPLASWETYKRFCKALSDERDRYIDLVTGLTVYPPGEGPNQALASASVSIPKVDPEIAKLMLEGGQAAKIHDLTRAQENFNRVIEMDPKFPNVHAALGLVYCLQNNNDECFREWRKEEEYHPDELAVYNAFARRLEFLHRDDEALQQYQDILKIDPTNLDAVLAASRILSKEKKDSDAVEMLEKAAARSPESKAVQYALGNAYLLDKQPDKGIAELKKVVAADTRPVMLNDAAYILAEASVGLDLAEEYAGEAIHQLEADSLKTEDDDAALANTRLLAMTWDTLGWVYFRKGEYDKALPYLRISWLLSQSGTVGDHLGQLYEHQGKKQEAAHQYRLALSASSPAENNGEIAEHYKHLAADDPEESDFPTVGHHAPTRAHVSAGEELSRMRTVKLFSASRESGSAMFTLVFSPGKIEEIKYVSGNETLKALTSQIAGAKFTFDFPDAGPVHVMRRGAIKCGVTGCDLTFLLSDSASGVQLDVATK